MSKQSINLQEMSRLGFFKLFLLELFSEKMDLPLAFTKSIPNQLPELVLLTDEHNKYVWQVKVGKTSDNKYFFHDGWSTFIKDISIKNHELLVFKYFGKGFFSVKLFYSGGFEKKLAFATSIFKRIESKEDKAEEAGNEGVEVKEEDQDEDYEEDKEENGEEEEEEDEDKDEVEEEEEEEDDNSNEEEDFSQNNVRVKVEEEEGDVDNQLQDEESRYGRIEVPHGSDGEEENFAVTDNARPRRKHVQVKQGTVSARGHKRRTTDIVGTSATNEQQRDKKRTRDLGEDVDSKRTHRWKRITMRCGEELFQSGLAVRPKNPYFMSRIKGRRNELYVPLNFVKSESVNLKEVTYLLDSKGRTYDLTYTPWTGRRVNYTGGWRRFCDQNSIKEGDICICEFVPGKSGRYVKVTVVRFDEGVSPSARAN